MTSKSLQPGDILTYLDVPQYTYYKDKKPVLKVIEESTIDKPALKVRVITPAIRTDNWGNVQSFHLMMEFFEDPLAVIKVASTQ